jgi:cysteine desulfurase
MKNKKNNRFVYLDNNSTTPIKNEVVDKIAYYLKNHYANSSNTINTLGKKASEKLAEFRVKIAQLTSANPNDIYFTSGSTESINIAIKGLCESNYQKHIITVKTEHSAVLETCEYLEKKGTQVTYLDVDTNGIVDMKQLEKNIRDNTILISIMLANNETGVIQPIEKIATIAKKYKILFMSDVTQAIGKMNFNYSLELIDILTFSSHKMYGPKGISALYLNNSAKNKIKPLIHGGGQENSIRSGTVNLPLISGFAEACKFVGQMVEKNEKEIFELRQYFESEIKNNFNVQINGCSAERLPNTSNITFLDYDYEDIAFTLSDKIAFSNGSACKSSVIEPSHVLLSMGLDRAKANSSVRFSFGIQNTKEEVDYVLDLLKSKLC